jgi:hypothetical protein
MAPDFLALGHFFNLPFCQPAQSYFLLTTKRLIKYSDNNTVVVNLATKGSHLANSCMVPLDKLDKLSLMLIRKNWVE